MQIMRNSPFVKCINTTISKQYVKVKLLNIKKLNAGKIERTSDFSENKFEPPEFIKVIGDADAVVAASAFVSDLQGLMTDSMSKLMYFHHYLYYQHFLDFR